MELLQPAESVIFYILDSHRPYDLCNIYSEDQVRILGKADEDEEIPEYSEIFRDESVNFSCPFLADIKFGMWKGMLNSVLFSLTKMMRTRNRMVRDLRGKDEG